MPKANRRYLALVNLGTRETVCAKAVNAVADRDKARVTEMTEIESIEQAIAKVDEVLAKSHRTRLTCDHYQHES
jgi:hypothetical protein